MSAGPTLWVGIIVAMYPSPEVERYASNGLPRVLTHTPVPQGVIPTLGWVITTIAVTRITNRTVHGALQMIQINDGNIAMSQDQELHATIIVRIYHCSHVTFP